MKTFSLRVDPLTNEEYWEVYLRGQQLLNEPLLNKASAFTQEERLSLGLSGLLRTGVSTLDLQVQRSYDSFLRKPDDLEKYIFLQGLLNRNEVLFYRLLCDRLTEMVPIVYTPTVGQACLELSHITRRYRGLYLSPENNADIDQILQGVSLPSVSLIVVLANGCFDVLHAGHIAHLREAAAMGDRLVVALTADAFVGKGPGRPIQKWEDRAAVLEALRYVDQVVESTNAYTAILKVRPTIFVKGIYYRHAEIDADREACRIVGAQMRFTMAPKKSTTEILKRARECALL